MKFKVLFPDIAVRRKFEKKLLKISKRMREKIMTGVEDLGKNPLPEGKKFRFLAPPVEVFEYTARYRLRIGDYRVLYDVDCKKKIVWVFVLRQRGKTTYKKT
ncbi:MAG: type II toxin-antitoxin system RelE/ParE family toxin [Elusimicrobiota bacterium]|nr:type II toxin-antitoxin system RelE/ParE family toxin [Elusimicrobiota bacterium]